MALTARQGGLGDHAVDELARIQHKGKGLGVLVPGRADQCELDLKPQIGHTIGFQGPISTRGTSFSSRAQHTARTWW